MEPATLAVTRDSGVARVVLNRPERRNAMSLEMLSELDRVIADVARDPAVHVVTIAGAGPVFSAGHDLNEMQLRDESFYAELFAQCTDVMLALQRIRQPVIAQVHGAATAAGCQLVAASDLALASEGTRFSTPGVKIGLFCSTPMVPLSRAIGRKRALQMLLTGDPIDAETARDWGLINEVVAATDLESAVGRLAQTIMQASPEVVGIGKAAFYDQIDRPQPDAYDATCPVMTENASHADAQAGIAAFLQKRPAEWPSQS